MPLLNKKNTKLIAPPKSILRTEPEDLHKYLLQSINSEPKNVIVSNNKFFWYNLAAKSVEVSFQHRMRGEEIEKAWELLQGLNGNWENHDFQNQLRSINLILQVK